MNPAERDAAHLWDMADAARRVVRLVRGLDYEAFVTDERTGLAIERLLENIGEAASHVSKARRDQLSAIPWAQIIGIRNILAHQYGTIDPRRVWESATEGVPELLERLAPHVDPER
jgi:uncharacterized protein with HEPN domain